MFNFSINRNVIIKLSIAFLLTTLVACKSSNTDPNAYLSVSITGSNADNNVQSKASDSRQYATNVLPDGITRIDFNITDSNNKTTSVSLPVGSKTETISIRVAPHRNLVIDIEALTGETVSFKGQTEISALRPGESFPLTVSLEEIGAPPTGNTVTLSISPAVISQYEGDDGASNLITFTATLSALANGNVTADTLMRGLTATVDSDFDNASNVASITIPAGQLSTTLSAVIIGDLFPEEDETFEVTLSNVSANATLGNATAIGVIISDDYRGRLNDTGVTLCGDYTTLTSSNAINCITSGSSKKQDGVDIDDDPVPAGQDAHYGRDVANNDDSDGLAGFSYTKLGIDGIPLADQTQDYATQPWGCVKDNHTGLIWEVKTTTGLQNATSTYEWINTTGINDGGVAGRIDESGICTSVTGCDTESYVVDMNQASSCGASNWRMPTISELLSIMNSGQFNPAIDTNYFPNTLPSDNYWTSSSLAASSLNNFAWSVDSYYGRADAINKFGLVAYIRLVRTEFIPQ